MNRKYSLALVLCMVILGTIPTAIAVTGHNLVMGFEEGDQFQYTYSNSETGDKFDFYAEVETVPIVNENISDYYQIYGSALIASYYYENGTEIVPLSVPYLLWGAMPIGNWSFIQGLFENHPTYDFQFINTASEWGFHYDEEFTGVTRTTTTRYSKTDGAFTLYKVVDDPEVGATKTIQVVREGFGTGIDSTLIIVGVVGVVAIIAIAAIVMKRR